MHFNDQVIQARQSVEISSGKEKQKTKHHVACLESEQHLIFLFSVFFFFFLVVKQLL